MQMVNRGKSTNILRVVATLFVFLLHGRSYIPRINELPRVINWVTYLPAWAGVWIFLFLSGYGVGCGFFSKRYQLTDERGKIKIKLFIKFYIGRFMKIAPIYYVYCFIFEIFSNNFFMVNNPKYIMKILTFTFNGNGGVTGLGHLWYISTAIQLYLFMPLIYLFIEKIKAKKETLIGVYCLIMFLGMFIRCFLIFKGFDWYSVVYTNCLTNIDLIALGMIVAEIKSYYSIPSRKSIKSLAWLMFFALVLYNCYIYYIGTNNYLYLYRCVLPSAYVSLCGLIMLFSGNHQTKNNFGLCIIDYFAKYSYSFYLLHMSVFIYLEQTLLKTNWFLSINSLYQYAIFFTISILIILILAIPLNCVEERILEIYRNKNKIR